MLPYRKASPKQRQVKGLCQQFVLNGVEFWGFKCWLGLLVVCLVNGGALNQVLNESEDSLINPPGEDGLMWRTGFCCSEGLSLKQR